MEATAELNEDEIEINDDVETRSKKKKSKSPKRRRKKRNQDEGEEEKGHDEVDNIEQELSPEHLVLKKQIEKHLNSSYMGRQKWEDVSEDMEIAVSVHGVHNSM